MDLFLDKKLVFEKMGQEALMSEDANIWPQQILEQLYKQVSYTSDYSPKIVLDTIDVDRRYALGRIELHNKLAINPRDDSTPPELLGRDKVVIPVIIKEGKLLPLDLLLSNGEVEPLTEERLRVGLFSPTMFDSIRKRPGDLSMVEQLYPPTRQYGGARGPLISDIGGGGVDKVSSTQPEFLLDAIIPTIKKAHLEEVVNSLNEDISLRTALLTNDAVTPFLSKLAEIEDKNPTSYLKKVAESIKPTVIQVSKVDNGFLIKTANPNVLAPTSDVVSRPEAVNTLGGDLISKVETGGTSTITTQPAIKDTLVDLEIKVIDSFGLYKVKTIGDNRELVGWVFPSVIAFTGEVLPLAIFSNGSESSMQEAIAGIPLAKQTDIIDAIPEGMGSFYYPSNSGAVALIPIEIKSEMETPNGIGYMSDTILGEHCVITKVPGLKEVSVIGEKHYGIPEDCGFLSFSLQKITELAANPEEFLKTAEAKVLSTAVRIITDGTCYSFSGAEIDKLAGIMDTQFLDKDNTIFLASILGQEPYKIKLALDNLRKQGQYELWFQAQPICTLRSKYAEARNRAEDYISKFPDLRVGLLKEAAPIEDPSAVDKILSLGFINPENISIFISYIPEIEKSICKLSELLLASRLGLNSVDQNAIQKSLVHLDKVVTGLKTIGTKSRA